MRRGMVWTLARSKYAASTSLRDSLGVESKCFPFKERCLKWSNSPTQKPPARSTSKERGRAQRGRHGGDTPYTLHPRE